MNKIKTSKGITLVALIITIIVLLILASVSIQEVIKDGIIGKAKEAKNNYTEAQTNKEIILQNHMEYLNANIIEDEEITFYINNTEFKAKKGMTWGTWVKTDYIGTNRFTINVGDDSWYVSKNGETMDANDGWIGCNDNYEVVDENDVYQHASYKIIENHKYEHRTSGPEVS